MKNQDKKKTILCILDGWGVAPDSSANAISIARKKNFDHLLENYPNSLLNASENEVGLPIGQFGNSEVGHMNIGAGRIILQDINFRRTRRPTCSPAPSTRPARSPA